MMKNEKPDDVERRNGDQARSEGSGRLTTAQVAAVQDAAAHEERKGGGESRTPVGPGSGDSDVDRETPLFDEAAIGKHRERWQAIQADFVDDPRQAVKQADELVAELIQQLAKSFADERSKLEGHWDRGDDVSTEDMRLALQRYRSFFGRLLSI
jgi:hypothetical protein